MEGGTEVETAGEEGGGEGLGGKQVQVAQGSPLKLRATAAGGKGCRCSSDGERKALRDGETPTPAEGVHRNAVSLSPWTSSGGLDLRAKEKMSSSPPLTRIPSRGD